MQEQTKLDPPTASPKITKKMGLSRAKKSLYAMPAIAVGWIAVSYGWPVYPSVNSNEIYKILFGAIGFTGMLSSLALRASSSSSNICKKSIYYRAGELLFHSTVLFSIAAIMQYFSLQIYIGRQGVAFYVISVFFSAVFFFWGILKSSRSLDLIFRVLLKKCL